MKYDSIEGIYGTLSLRCDFKSIHEIEFIDSYIPEQVVQSNGIVMYLIIQQDMMVKVVINDLCH